MRWWYITVYGSGVVVGCSCFLYEKWCAKYGSIVVTIGLQQGECKRIELSFGARRSLPSVVKYMMM